MSILNKIFGDANEKVVNQLLPSVEKINSLEKEMQALSDAQFPEKSKELKNRLAKGESLDEILLNAFALVREAGKRTLNQRHFDVQLMGGMVLHQGKIAEMKTGEGKTLSATLAVYLNALSGNGVHVVTVNDYLAKRDMVWMGQIYDFLGLTTGCITHESAYLYDGKYVEEIPNSKIQNPNEIQNPKSKGLTTTDELDKERDVVGGFKIVENFLRPVSRKEGYAADITYGTNNEFGFDYLRDNMAYDLKDQVQRGHNFAIVDEVDSILIDEARTPLIISGHDNESTDKYFKFAKIVEKLEKDKDYEVDEKMKAATYTDAGQNRVVGLLGSDPWAENDIPSSHQLEAALRAKALFQRDKDYVVKDGQIIIVDEFTGRMLMGRRYSEGLHQAIEAKEGVKVQAESKTYATVTFQNYFRMYKKLSGMTGTALTSAEEFDKVYKLEVVAIPTNKEMRRQDLPDRIYKTAHGKIQSVVQEIKERHKKGQPVLVGTVSIEKNEYLGKLLEREGVPHRILNAKKHEMEGQVIAQAGKLGAVTIATNMAGRGVDIILGGNPANPEEQKKVIELGGLHVLATDRHDARRIDNQLRGRSGRQGDPGSSQFFVSLEDDLMRIFGGDRIKSLMEMLKMPEDQPIESKMISKAIESAQGKVEGFNFDARKHVLEYDDVMNKHREVIYKRRKEILEKASAFAPSSTQGFGGQSMASADKQNPNSNEGGGLREYVLGLVKTAGFTDEDYEKKEKEVGPENMRQIEKFVCLQVLDNYWMEHLENMEHLRDSVRLRAYGQRDPLVEYKGEGHGMFKKLLVDIDAATVNAIFQARMNAPQPAPKPITVGSAPAGGGPSAVGRNDSCPCGSGKKYKKCHGK